MYQTSQGWLQSTTGMHSDTNDIRRKNNYLKDFLREWVSHKLYDLFSASPSHFHMYLFLQQNDGVNEIKLDIRDEFRGIWRAIE